MSSTPSNLYRYTLKLLDCLPAHTGLALPRPPRLVCLITHATTLYHTIPDPPPPQFKNDNSLNPAAGFLAFFKIFPPHLCLPLSSLQQTPPPPSRSLSHILLNAPVPVFPLPLTPMPVPCLTPYLPRKKGFLRKPNEWMAGTNVDLGSRSRICGIFRGEKKGKTEQLTETGETCGNGL